MQIFMETRISSSVTQRKWRRRKRKGRGCAGQGGEEKPLNDLYVNSEDVQYY